MGHIDAFCFFLDSGNHTNAIIKNRVVCYDIRELGKQLKKIGMHIVQDQVWNRVTENRFNKIRLTHDKDGEPLPDDILASLGQKATRYYMDEFHLLLKEEQTAAYSVEIWKRFRKWGGIPTGITQNVKDLLSSREVENIFENSDFIYIWRITKRVTPKSFFRSMNLTSSNIRQRRNSSMIEE